MKKISLTIIIIFLCIGRVYAANYALYFDGVDDYVTIPDSNLWDFGAGDFSIEMWFNMEEVQAGNHYYIFADINNGMTDGLSLILSPSPRFDVFAGGNGYQYFTWGGLADTWYHAALVRESTNMRHYINGVQVGPTVTVADDISGGSEGIRFGFPIFGYNPVLSFAMYGKFDEVRFWNAARSQEEIQNWMYYSLSGTEPGLIGYWNFDEGSGQTANEPIYGNYGQLGSAAGGDVNDPTWVLSDGLYGQNPIPEPASLFLLGMGLLGTGLFKKFRRLP